MNPLVKHTNETISGQSSSSGLTLAQRLAATRNTPTLLLDTSGSMSTECEPGHSRIEALRNIVASLKVVGKVYYFNSTCAPCLKTAIPSPTGGTYMAGAFKALKSQGIKKVLMITDGEANDQQAALLEVEGLTIEIMYVGTGDPPKFLQDLATKAGGKFCTKEDLSKQKELSEKITLLLGSGNTGGPIQL